jgi:hypothetical protein
MLAVKNKKHILENKTLIKKATDESCLVTVLS